MVRARPPCKFNTFASGRSPMGLPVAAIDRSVNVQLSIDREPALNKADDDVAKTSSCGLVDHIMVSSNHDHCPTRRIFLESLTTIVGTSRSAFVRKVKYAPAREAQVGTTSVLVSDQTMCRNPAIQPATKQSLASRHFKVACEMAIRK